MTTSQLTQLNNRLARDLGRNPYGGGLLAWRDSETLTHPMRVPGYKFVTSPAGLEVATPLYEVRKMNPAFDHQWVVCKWEAPIPAAAWHAAFGTDMEWPNHGEYYPTNVALPQGVEPTMEWTERVIAAERERRTKTLADHEAAIQSGMDRDERRASNRRFDIIEDAMPAFMNLPGSKSTGVSFPAVTLSPTAR
jgi:hypothetical protein